MIHAEFSGWVGPVQMQAHRGKVLSKGEGPDASSLGSKYIRTVLMPAHRGRGTSRGEAGKVFSSWR